MSKNPLRRVPALAALALLAAGCGEDDPAAPGDSRTNQDVARATDVATAVVLTAFPGTAASLGTSRASTRLAPGGEYGLTCPIVSVPRSDGGTALIVSLEYGAGCTSELTGQIHSGRMDVTVSPTEYAIAFAAFTARGYALDGAMGGTYAGSSLTLAVDDLSIDDGTAWLVDAALTGVRADAGTPTLFGDDSWSVTGGAVVSEVDARTYTLTITEGLLIQSGCVWPVRGRMTLRIGTSPIVTTVDFGTGTCDDLATVTTAGESRTIHLGSGLEE